MNLSAATVEEQIALLPALPRNELVECWIDLFGAPPFKGMRHRTLVRGIACKLQERAFGSIKLATSRQLIKIARRSSKQKEGADQYVRSGSQANWNASLARRPKLQVGSKLIREWNGRTYEVVVSDAGFILNGIKHSSLSACAKAITGAHWSGPRFFGART